jgi:D-threonate/D-erythronate kinase
MKGNWAIIADDFTGSGDSAVQFASPDEPVRFPSTWDPEKIKSVFPRTIAVNTDSRFLDPLEASSRVERVTRSLLGAGYRHFFKKIDSTLRGNVADEVSAMMRAGGFRCAVVAPAAPRNGRTVRKGLCMIRGIPVSETELAKDPFTPVTDGRIAHLFKVSFPGKIEEIPLSRVRDGAAPLKRRIQEGLDKGIRIFIPDSETMGDLESIAVLADLPEILFAGSSGFAEALADTKPRSTPEIHRHPAGDILFAIGSLTRLSADQCRTLKERERICEIVIDSGAALGKPEKEAARILRLTESSTPDRPILLRTDGIIDSDRPDAGLLISRFIGCTVNEMIGIRSIGLVYASGGDTAARIVENLDTECIEITGEILPGIPYGFLESASHGRRIHLITKSGGFGNEDTLRNCIRLIAAPSSDDPKGQRSGKA